MSRKVLVFPVVALALTACAGQKSMVISELQDTDKQLNCEQIKLEINEAKFFRGKAEKNQKFGIKHVVSPLGYVSSYTSAEDAKTAADGRIEYLNNIYNIKECDKQPKIEEAALTPPASSPAPAPAAPPAQVYSGRFATPPVSPYAMPPARPMPGYGYAAPVYPMGYGGYGGHPYAVPGQQVY